MNRLKDIAQLVRWMENKEAKSYVVANWDKVKELSEDDKLSIQLMDTILSEDLSRIKNLI